MGGDALLPRQEEGPGNETLYPVSQQNESKPQPKVLDICLHKTANVPKVGLDVDHGDSKTLKVTKVKDGLINKMNETEGLPTVKEGDVIIEVNGVTGDSKAMLAACANSDDLTMKVLASN